MPLSAADLPDTRPPGLRLTSVDARWWRLDAQPPADWSWRPFPTAVNRFDPAGGEIRARYAASTARGAFRERYAEARRHITDRDAGVRLVRLTGRLRVLDLRSEQVLDRLHLDDEISTGRAPRVFAACGALSALVVRWYAERCHGVVYRSRTTPVSSANLAFFSWAPVVAADLGGLTDHRGLLAHLILDDGFRVDLPGWL